ncbi:metallophosphoesterase [Acidisoma cellulosilytica]|uniref:Metallophosphoesterase n=1 Tax=Acidisoma cellulosilyticum TaxID=2802395 RepID=A0A963Z605_9PROT|nr:metallophosphoesterase [Acidisoma cellulosilyticum]MCB8882695.1 metallophosphoesterase [Acidisoma cellulosilyticum]
MRQDEEDGQPGRRRVMECAAWIGTGVLWAVSGGVPRTVGLIGSAAAEGLQDDFTFLQMSDNHIGFKAGPYQDVPGTLQAAIGRAKTLPRHPSLMLHTGDISHFSKEEQFEQADAINAKLGLDIHHVPGEHDMLDPGKKLYLARYGKKTKGDGWYSFDDHGVHFIGLSNVTHSGPDGQWLLGADQIAWLADDLRAVSASTPIIVFAHIPLWTIYAKWGWGTADASAALPLFRRFGSVTFLNGHIHQIVQKVEGNIAFHTARSTAFPQPAPGTAAHPGPIMTITSATLGDYLGITSATSHITATRLALTDTTLT